MARVEWTRLSGDDVEAVVSMLLCLEYPDAERVRPGEGDGGIDVMVPLPDGGVAVYQVKRHAENLDASQRAKLKRSHDRLHKSELAQQYGVRTWYPTMPLDPTPTDLKWLRRVTDGQPWDAHWKGLAFIEALVAKYPIVVDYYLHDGRERADGAISRLTQLLTTKAQVDAGEPLSPRDAVDTLEQLFATLAGNDPFYEYGLSFSPLPPPAPGPRPERVVMVAQHELSGGAWATIEVIARCNESAKERPITVELTFEPGDDAELRQGFRDFLKYGTPFEAPVGTVSGTLDAPGGLGGAFTGGISLQQSDELGENPHLRMQVIDPEDAVLAECQIHRVERSTGPTGEGMRVVFDSDAELFKWQVLFDLTTPGTTYRLTTNRAVTGQTPADVLAPLQVLHALHAPNRIRMAQTHGPASAGHVIGGFTHAHDTYTRDLLALVEMLTKIQEHTTTRLTVPETVTGPQMRELHRAAALLRGTILQTDWTEPVTGVGPTAPDGEAHARFDTPLTVKVDGVHLELGWLRAYYFEATLSEEPQREGDSWVCTFVPAGGDSCLVLQWVPSPDAQAPIDEPLGGDATAPFTLRERVPPAST